mmetsp:Transcript_27224/g.44379  ORF Transcript_27224/g.44379 Transcript_27224/m.44379 type:complete len:90 (+) Transcript_27224:810-1079(+)
MSDRASRDLACNTGYTDRNYVSDQDDSVFSTGINAIKDLKLELERTTEGDVSEGGPPSLLSPSGIHEKRQGKVEITVELDTQETHTTER